MAHTIDGFEQVTALMERDGRVTISFNSQGFKLAAPNGKFYLPCASFCGRLMVVDANTVSIVCEQPGCMSNPKAFQDA